MKEIVQNQANLDQLWCEMEQRTELLGGQANDHRLPLIVRAAIQTVLAEIYHRKALRLNTND